MFKVEKFKNYQILNGQPVNSIDKLCRLPTANCPLFNFVRMKGLEPPRLTAPDPKSGAAANYATSAFIPPF
jgi:hypothetical protein